ncbi:MAG: hypothetical protein ABI763_15275 [Bacteroidota bacterium]
MNPEEILDRQIENYVHHRMDADERMAFEKSLRTDPELKKQVSDLVTLKSIYSKELFELMKLLNSTEDKLTDENFFDEGRDSQ